LELPPHLRWLEFDRLLGDWRVDAHLKRAPRIDDPSYLVGH
jgi:hypothetical protein